jgi:capsule biosynthesis phosphatase
VAWLDRLAIPYDEIIVGKPWCGFEGFYVDDKAVRPDEFATLEPEEIKTLLAESAARLKTLKAQA